MTFNEYLDEIKGLLSVKYPTIDFDGDLGVSNKLNDLAWIVAKRINDPAPIKEERRKDEPPSEEWARLY